MRKKIKIIGLITITILLIVGASSFYHQKKKEQEEKKHQTEVEDKFHSYMQTTKDTLLLKKEAGNWQNNGKIHQGTIIELESIQEDYYQIKNTPYYVAYQDVEPAAEEKRNLERRNALLWNEDLITTNPTTLYQNDKKVITLNKSIQAPIIKKGMDFNTIVLNEEYYEVRSADIKKIVTKEYHTEATLERISILNFQDTENCKEKLKYLVENKYQLITEQELLQFLRQEIRLPQKTTMIIFENETPESKSFIQEYNLVINYQKDLKLSYQEGDQQTSKEDQIYYYKIQKSTTQKRFLDILNGKKEEIIKKAQKIAVLNYHFFYDQKTESCNESICLEVENFKKQLEYLKENNFKTLTMQEFNDWLDKKIELPTKSVLLTIDDGAMGTNTHLPQILEEYNMKATLFLISGWWPMSKYRTGNLEIQSHGHDLHHNDFCVNGNCGVKGLLLSQEQLQKDLQLSKSTIGSPIAFCYPFYAHNPTLTNAVKQEFSLAFVGGNQKASRGSDKYKIPRYIIYKNTALDSFKKMINP